MLKFLKWRSRSSAWEDNVKSWSDLHRRISVNRYQQDTHQSLHNQILIYGHWHRIPATYLDTKGSSLITGSPTPDLKFAFIYSKEGTCWAQEELPSSGKWPQSSRPTLQEQDVTPAGKDHPCDMTIRVKGQAALPLYRTCSTPKSGFSSYDRLPLMSSC